MVMFPFLFFISLLALVIGLLIPSIYSRLFKEKPSRKKILLYFGLATLLFLILGVTTTKPVSSPTQTVKQNITTKPTSLPTQTAQLNVTNTNKQYVFDVPALVGKNIDEIRVILGEPEDGKLKEPNDQQIELGTTEWNNTFEKGGKELLVTYNIKTRKVIDFFISTDDSSGATDNTRHLLELGNLTENDPRYKIEFVKAFIKPSVFTGVKAIPR